MQTTPTDTTSQGGVTLNLKMSRATLAERERNSGSGRGRKSYPGGNKPENLMVLPGELVFSTKHELRATQGNRITAMSSLNGYSIEDNQGKERTPEEIAEDFVFIGLASTPSDPRDRHSVSQGYSGITVGTGTTVNTGMKSFVPGQKIMVKLPEPGALDRTRTNPRGVSRTKILPMIEPREPGDAMPSINSAIGKILVPAPNNEVPDRVTGDFINTNGTFKKGGAHRQHAAAFKLLIPMIVARAIDFFANRTMPNSGLDLLKQLGLGADSTNDEVKTSGPQLHVELLKHLFPLAVSTGGLRKNGSVVSAIASLPGVQRVGTADSTRFTGANAAYANLAVSLDSLLEGMWLNAKEVVDSQCIGRAIGKASRGAKLDILLGHTHI